MHYDKNRRRGNPLFERKIEKGLPCTVNGCSKPIICNSYCDMHNRRFRRHGDPLFINPKCNRDGNYIKRARTKTAQWKKDNPKKNSAFNKARKARVKQATPKWADLKAMYEFYLNCPEGYHVDHIIPLNGKTVSGLHTIENLQYLSAIENLRKSNKIA